MPTITRRRGESVIIGGDVQGKQVHLGIQALAIVRVL
jgi:sRNA-binding carbon storage regulator CsrA